MNRRLVTREVVEKAYKRDLDYYEENTIKDEREDNLDALPDEMFQILGKLVSFIEKSDKIEGEKR